MNVIVNFDVLVGLTLDKAPVLVRDEEVYFTTTCGRQFRLYHESNCCEYVALAEVCGDWADLVGSPILMAEESSGVNPDDESCTWTFYRLATQKGYVTLRWVGESDNYSTAVSLWEIKE